jgi:hypothetical protein
MGQTASGTFDGMGTGTFVGGGQPRWITAAYRFATHGGAQSSIVIGRLPSGVSIIGGQMNVIEVPVGVGASIGITAQTAGDLVAVAAIAGAPWSTTGLKDVVPKRNTPFSSGIVLTADRDILFVISGAALTAGKVDLQLEIVNAQ